MKATPDDHFSAIAREYARGRLGYPAELFQFLAERCPDRACAWDCATGSGQAAVDLAGHFDRVVATDVSAALLRLAPQHPRIEFRCVPAEASGIEAKSVDLVTVAQAIHWFDLPAFWMEVNRVTKPGGVLAFWGYTWPRVDPAVDRLLDELRLELVAYWPERSVRLQNEYAEVTPPFAPIATPRFTAAVQWDADEYLDHLRSWSAVRYCRERTGVDPVATFAGRLKAIWPSERRAVSWPLHLKVFRVGEDVEKTSVAVEAPVHSRFVRGHKSTAV